MQEILQNEVIPKGPFSDRLRLRSLFFPLMFDVA